jgi:hypothetical protein
MTQTNAASPAENAFDSELVTFLHTIANSFVKWDLIRFFNDNPHAVDPAETIARFSTRDVREVERQLDELVAAGALSVRLVAGIKAYMLTPDAGMRAMIHRFIQTCDDKPTRLQAIRYVLELTAQPRR